MGERLSVPQRLVRRLPIGARVGLAGLGLIGGLGGVACGPAKGGEVQPPPAAELANPTAVPTAAPTAKSDLATAVPTEARPTVAPTESPKPTATPTSEAIKEQPCGVLPDQVCSSAEVVQTEAGRVAIAFRELPQGTPIFSPVDGQVGKAQSSNGLVVRVRNLEDPKAFNFTFQGNLRVDNMLSVDVKRGDIIAYVQDIGVRFFGGEYRVALTVSRVDGGKVVDDTNILKEMFPQAFTKPPQQSATQPQGGTIYIPSYRGK